MSRVRDSGKRAVSKDLRIALNLALNLAVSGALAIFIVFMIWYPHYRNARKERFEARAEKAFGKLPVLQKVAAEVEAEFGRAKANSIVEIGASFAGAGKPAVKKMIDPTEFASVDRFELMVWNIAEGDLPQLDLTIATALAHHELERVRVRPFLTLPERSVALEGGDVELPDGVWMGEVRSGEVYTVTAAGE